MSPSEDAVDSHAIPLRGLVFFLLGALGGIAAYSTYGFVTHRDHLPLWFAPFFFLFIGVLMCADGLYFHAVIRKTGMTGRPGPREVAILWALMELSVLCTSSVHQFYPFRPDGVAELINEWDTLTPILKYNFALTAGSLLAVVALRAAHKFGCERAALTGLVLLAAVMLIPNDDCNNDFNNPWVRLLGASPVMFAPNALLLLVGYCGLHGIRPRRAMAVMAAINALVLLIGLGHLTRIIW